MTAPGRVPIDWPALMRPVALTLLGPPNARLSTVHVLRYGNRGSLAVHVGGPHSGTWRDHEADKGGGVLALVVRERGGTEREALAWLRDAGLLNGAGGSLSRGPAAAALDARDGQLRAGIEARSTTDVATRASSPGAPAPPRDTTAAARRVWDATKPLAGTLAERYLHARGVGHVAVAPSLRFSPALTHPYAPGRFPALVAGVQDAHGGFLAVHRIYLDREGAGKANVEPARASLGGTAGGAVRLGEPEHGRLLVGEGIETTAAAMARALLDLPGWAAIGTGGLSAIELPEHVSEVVIAADRDAAGLKAAAALARRLEAEGADVEICRPHKGDFNDALLLMASPPAP